MLVGRSLHACCSLDTCVLITRGIDPREQRTAARLHSIECIDLFSDWLHYEIREVNITFIRLVNRGRHMPAVGRITAMTACCGAYVTKNVTNVMDNSRGVSVFVCPKCHKHNQVTIDKGTVVNVR